MLQGVEILDGDYQHTVDYITQPAFFYFDPPYKPVNESNSCTSYMPQNFDDPEQIRLAKFCEELNSLSVRWMLSNSDPRQKNPENTFFDDLYANYNIRRIGIFRSICSIAAKRETVNELLITNY